MAKDKSTEDRIFEVATEVFLEKGMDGTTMQDIADRAGINKSLLNYYFRSKDRLFNAVFELIATKMIEKLAPVLEESLPLEDKIRFFFNEHISFLQKNPRLPLFLLNEVNRNPDRLRRFVRDLNIEKMLEALNSKGYGASKRKKLKKEEVLQLLTTVISISIFPFAAKGVFEVMLEKVGIRFDDYVEARKRFAAEFVIASLGNIKLK